jgi:hypothetical protein
VYFENCIKHVNMLGQNVKETGTNSCYCVNSNLLQNDKRTQFVLGMFEELS